MFILSYQILMEWFSSLEIPNATPAILLNALTDACNWHDDYRFYIQNLSALHRRRVKYRRILATQPLAHQEQIAPRSLLEYGICDTGLLSSWMVWRKWIYDIDNRSAQETGYLFEPILASCLGGTPISAPHSPVKRVDDNGNVTDRGRQVDCFVADENVAYEFKLRVSIAASGQGRFSEELSFPRECATAGLTPILLVLDSTPSSRLSELQKAFIAAGGTLYQGEEAWVYMEKKAGEIMSIFLTKYIKPPIEAMELITDNTPVDLFLRWSDDCVSIRTDKNNYEIHRL
ncbi:MAG: restriction endonuclease [Candidatus Parabeggiatoa sp. nov. 2]|nr:MAG: restriction endonuclease [Gammaproteobacteria bacterium]